MSQVCHHGNKILKIQKTNYRGGIFLAHGPEVLSDGYVVHYF